MSSSKKAGLAKLRDRMLKNEEVSKEYKKIKDDPEWVEYEADIIRRKEADMNAQNVPKRNDEEIESSNEDYKNFVNRLTRHPDKMLRIRDVGDNKKMWTLFLGHGTTEVYLDPSFLSKTKFSVELIKLPWIHAFKVSFANEIPTSIEFKENLLTENEIYNLKSKLYDFMVNYFIPTLQAALKDSSNSKEVPSPNFHSDIPNLNIG